jgi:hypothetical protein
MFLKNTIKNILKFIICFPIYICKYKRGKNAHARKWLLFSNWITHPYRFEPGERQNKNLKFKVYIFVQTMYRKGKERKEKFSLSLVFGTKNKQFKV